MTGPAFEGAAEIEASLELFAERCGDPTPYVYATLFARYPQMQPHFWRDIDGAVRGAMLSQCFEALLDFVGERRFGDRMIRNELVTHEGYDIPREIYATFFEVIRDTARAQLADDWTASFETAWRNLLRALASSLSIPAA